MKDRIIILTLALLVLAGCGVKPSSVAPPDSMKGKAFPRTYPDLSTDPLPGGLPQSP